MKKTSSIFFISILFILGIPSVIFSQLSYKISGTVRSTVNNDAIPGAVIIIDNTPKQKTITDKFGGYSFVLPPGRYLIHISHVCFVEKFIEINIDSETNKDIYLENYIKLNDAIVYTNLTLKKQSEEIIGKEKLNLKGLEKTPVFLGEKDLFKTISFLPGISTPGDISSGFYVRGGSPDQNLILYNDIPVYNPSHILGIFSVFNNEIIESATLFKGNEPAQYGGRLSSILDISTRGGDSIKTKISGGVGNIASRFIIEGPLVKSKSSYILSLRKSYIDYLLNLSDKYKNNSVGFFDMNFGFNNVIDDKNQLVLTGYVGNDNINLGNGFAVDWGNKLGSIQWKKIINERLQSNSTILTSIYNYNKFFNTNNINYILNENISNYGIKQNIIYNLNEKTQINLGINSIYFLTNPKIELGKSKNSINTANTNSIENVVYFDVKSTYTPKISIDWGLRVSSFSILTNKSVSLINNDQTNIPTATPLDQLTKTYFTLEPRFSGSLLINKKSSLKLAYSKNVQHLHLLNNSNAGEFDRWITDSYGIQPEISNQVSLGIDGWVAKNMFQIDCEIYYKSLTQQLELKDGINIGNFFTLENDILKGIGRSYGLEIKLLKKTGKLSGWISYSIAKSEKLINEINNYNWYNASQDKTHILSLVALYKINSKLSISSYYTFNTGNAITLPVNKYLINDAIVFEYGEKNKNRMPNYSRLDFSVTYEYITNNNNKTSWNFTLYNAIGRENPYKFDFQNNPINNLQTQIKQTSLFRWVPSFSYTFSL